MRDRLLTGLRLSPPVLMKRPTVTCYERVKRPVARIYAQIGPCAGFEIGT